MDLIMLPVAPTPTNVLFPKVTALRLFPVGEVALSHEEPLFVDLIMLPDAPTPTNILFPKVTPMITFPVGEVALSHEEPLSVDLIMLPDAPTPTNVLFPKVTPFKSFAVGEVTLSQDEPLSVDLTIFPDSASATNTPGTDCDDELSEVFVELSEVVVEDEVGLEVLSSDFAHEETITAILTIRTNQEVRLFILFIYRKC